MARLWRLDIGENVLEIEKYYDYECRDRDSLPLGLRGRILEDNEIVDEINVAENDVLLYEVQSMPFLKKNNMYAFIPK
jgi:hypothetical protein